jgi:hypothetical protein
MTDRLQIEQLVRELHTARLEGNLERLCALYADEARLRIAGSTDGKPIAIAAIGIAEIRPRAAAHWRVDIHSKITGVRGSHRARGSDRRARRTHFLAHRILRAYLTFPFRTRAPGHVCWNSMLHREIYCRQWATSP